MLYGAENFYARLAVQQRYGSRSRYTPSIWLMRSWNGSLGPICEGVAAIFDVGRRILAYTKLRVAQRIYYWPVGYICAAGLSHLVDGLKAKNVLITITTRDRTWPLPYNCLRMV